MNKRGIFKLDVSASSGTTSAGLHAIGVDVFEAPQGEAVRVSVQAVNTPYNASFGDLPTTTKWSIVQPTSPNQPTEIREFVMPNDDLHFEILYRFPLDAQQGAHYSRTISGGGQSDGPFDVAPIPYFQTVTLSYVFHPAK